MPWYALVGVHSVRSRADVDRIVDELATTDRVAVIGGGYIGLESAAVLAKFGKHVTVIEAQDRVLARVAGLALSRFYEREHRSHGVEVLLGVTVDCIVEEDGCATGVRLVDGEILPAEIWHADRLESVQNANDMTSLVAKAITGELDAGLAQELSDPDRAR